MRPLPGISVEVVTREGDPVPAGSGGYLVIRKPWPSMLRTIYGDDARYREQYWSQIPGSYFTGDGARQDEDGYIWVMGRVDDVINVSGHRLSTMEVESALVAHPLVAEAAVVGRPDEIKGQGIVAFVTLQGELGGDEQTVEGIRVTVAERIGKFARPKRIIWADDLPKTRSGKIMRRLLRDIAEGRALGDVTTLRDPAVTEQLEERVKELQSQED